MVLKLSKASIIYLMSVVVLAAAIWLAVSTGAVSALDFEWILTLRTPRVLMAVFVGMGLAVSGAVLQALFLNPLCEPYILGISSGGSLGALISTAYGASAGIIHSLGRGGSAFAGAMLFTGILVTVSFRRGLNQISLLLTGVMLGFLGSGLISLWAALADPNGIQIALVWLLGNLGGTTLHQTAVVALGVLALVLVLWSFSRPLDALLTGEEGALTLGVDVVSLRRRLIFLSSLLVALCVSYAGMIGFVGLIIPHFVRHFTGSTHRHLIPLSALWGAILLVLADLLSRVAFRPYEIPVGVVTSLLGAPLFILLTVRNGRNGRKGIVDHG